MAEMEGEMKFFGLGALFWEIRSMEVLSLAREYFR